MAKSYKNIAMQILKDYPSQSILINNKEISVYSFNMQDTLNIGLEQIIKENGLKGKTFPIAIVQYNTYIPWTNNVGPMVAFIWSWGGPWAYIHNIQFPDCSESGSVPLNRVKEFMGEIPSGYFNKLM